MNQFKMSKLQVAVLWLIITTGVNCLQFLEECVPRDSVKIQVKGSIMEIRFFAPEAKGAEILRLALLNTKGDLTKEVTIYKYQAIIRINGKTKIFSLQPIYGNRTLHEWKYFRITVEKRFKVFDLDIQEPLLDIEEEVITNELIIKGSQVTVNCLKPEALWEVDKTEVSIPVIRNSTEDFSLFSKYPFFPIMTVGPDTLTLSWDDDKQTISARIQKMRGCQSFYASDFQFLHASNIQPLQAFREYNFTLMSEYIWEFGMYRYSVTASGSSVTAFSSFQRIQTISFCAKGQKFIIVQTTYKAPSPTLAPTPPLAPTSTPTVRPTLASILLLAIALVFFCVKTRNPA